MERLRINNGQRKFLLNDHVEEGIAKSGFASLSPCALIKKGRWRWECFGGSALELRVLPRGGDVRVDSVVVLHQIRGRSVVTRHRSGLIIAMRLLADISDL